MRSSIALVILVIACDTPPDVVLPEIFVGETSSLRVYRGESTSQICSGSLTVWQSHVDEVAEFLGSPGSPGPFYVVIPDEIGDYCRGNVSGCARPPVAAGAVSAVPHELAHLVAGARFGASIAFWSEGFAQSWSDVGTRLPRVPIIDDIQGEQSRDVSYAAGSHWMQWIAEEYGPEAVAAILGRSKPKDSTPERLEHLEDVLGESYVALQDRFWREARLYYPGFGRCGDTDEVLPAKSRLDFAVTLDCAVDPGPLRGALNTVYTTRVIEVEATGRYEVAVDPGSSLLLPCDSTDEPVDALRWATYEVGIPLSGPRAVPNPVTLRAGRYKLWLVAPDDAAVDMKVTILPAVSLTRLVP